MRSLIIGMGIGELYNKVLTELGHQVITVDRDMNKQAGYYDLDAALIDYGSFDCAVICTPNFTHYSIAQQVAARCKIVFVEKPGVKTASEWNNLVYGNKFTRFMMVKNNQYRSNFGTFKNLADNAAVIDLRWINYDRVPNPGTWFTNKEVAFGGVSRDLMPHLLSYITALYPNVMNDYYVTEKIFKQRWQLSDVTDTDYGKVDPTGTYDVDDYAKLTFKINDITIQLIADWRSKSINDQCIQFLMKPVNKLVNFELGLCPEDAYKRMIETAINNIANVDFWDNELKQDLWIHEMINA